MKPVVWWWRHVRGAALAVGGMLALSGSVLAQAPQDPAYQSPGEGWVISGIANEYVQWTYINNIARNGNNLRVWVINNYKEGNYINYGAKSRRTLFECECFNKRIRQINISIFSEVSARGKTIISSDDDFSAAWSSVAPGTMGEAIIEVACSR
ncbi:hypothetical protein NON00_23000 [Roseomonas sp. GC11]|uniref:surface-adhesin E family protein n=1 Tax=Roseomonas sp. GC11 TaxID=2950546 RepID=UPI002108C68F|nr:surface-adhesin E family protein [Roseomonas sp. GC11]MCQ4162778.1 hypothetical protein [Roseomonas sp. GC11]